MGRIWIVLSSLIVLLLSCATIKNNGLNNLEELTNVKLLEVKRFNSVNQIKAIRESMDTIYLVSPNKREYQIDSSKFITLKLTKVTRFRVGTMEQLGAWMIAGTDTLWHGPNSDYAPKFYWIDEN